MNWSLVYSLCPWILIFYLPYKYTLSERSTVRDVAQIERIMHWSYRILFVYFWMLLFPLGEGFNHIWIIQLQRSLMRWELRYLISNVRCGWTGNQFVVKARQETYLPGDRRSDVSIMIHKRKQRSTNDVHSDHRKADLEVNNSVQYRQISSILCIHTCRQFCHMWTQFWECRQYSSYTKCNLNAPGGTLVVCIYGQGGGEVFLVDFAMFV